MWLILSLDAGGVAVTCAISPYRGIRNEAREEIGKFIEVYVKCPVDECIKRDPKGLYKKALSGEIKNFTGISDPYEEPLKPEIVVETHNKTIQESVDIIMLGLINLGYISNATPDEIRKVVNP